MSHYADKPLKGWKLQLKRLAVGAVVLLVLCLELAALAGIILFLFNFIANHIDVFGKLAQSLGLLLLIYILGTIWLLPDTEYRGK